MNRKTIGIGIIILMLLLSACSKDKYEPFTPLSKVTVSPEREAAVQAALNGEAVPQPQAGGDMIVEGMLDYQSQTHQEGRAQGKDPGVSFMADQGHYQGSHLPHQLSLQS